jgi:hypothetical protein
VLNDQRITVPPVDVRAEWMSQWVMALAGRNHTGGFRISWNLVGSLTPLGEMFAGQTRLGVQE